MPRVIDCAENDRIELGDLVALLEDGGFDARDEENFASWAPALKRLANNRTFLGDLIIDELKQRCAGQLRDNQYNAQVIMLRAPGNGFFIRANMWPAASDTVIRQSGTDPFFYGLAHDHNFSFLTVGYLGPGYWSEYFEYDYDQVAGYPGEKVDLRFVEKTRLETGKVMLYRAHQDIHLQLPADAMSVSINIVETSPSAVFRDQYQFDTELGRIEKIMTRSSLESMLALAAHYGGGNGLDLIANVADTHPSDRIRWAAIRARADAAPTIDARIAVLEEATRSSSLLIAALAKREVAKVEAGRAWIENPPVLEAA